MSQRIQASIFESVSRVCCFVALGVGAGMNTLSWAPFLSLKAGGLACLLAACTLLLLAPRAEGTPATQTRPWRQLGGDERLPEDQARAIVAAARRKVLHTYAFLFALAAAVFLAVEIAGQVHLWLYPVA
jgi:hypothetical protein